MTITAPTRVQTVPVAASSALRLVLQGAPAPGMVLGAGEWAAWLRAGDGALVISRGDSIRLPNAIAVPLPAAALFTDLVAGGPAVVGAGGLSLAEWRLRVVRWWDPRPVLPKVDPGTLRGRVVTARRLFAPVADGGLGKALAGGDTEAVLAAARSLIGNGPGLTPLGDDVLAGTVAAAVLLGDAAGTHHLRRLVDRVAPWLCAEARGRTTVLAATLLGHACRGEVDDASAGLLRALAGRGDVAHALDGLLALGHSSGAGLATGILAGAAACAGGDA